MPPRDFAVPRDGGLARRLLWGLVVSVAVNLVLWAGAARLVRRLRSAPPRAPIEITRVVLPLPVKPPPPKPPPPKPPPPRRTPTPRVIPPKPIARRQPPPPVRVPPRRVARRIVPTPPSAPPRPTPVPPRMAPPAHNRVLTAPGPMPTPQTVLPGGHATPGVPLSAQPPGAGTHEAPPVSLPTIAPPSPPVHAAPPTPPHHDDPPPRRDPPAPPPHRESPPAPSGPTTEAQPLRQPDPEIPDELKQGEYKSSVRVTIEISAEGAVTGVTLRTTSGNAEIDRRVVAALKRGRYKPALQDGRPVASTLRFKFDFEVN